MYMSCTLYLFRILPPFLPLVSITGSDGQISVIIHNSKLLTMDNNIVSYKNYTVQYCDQGKPYYCSLARLGKLQYCNRGKPQCYRIIAAWPAWVSFNIATEVSLNAAAWVTRIITACWAS